MLGPYFDERMLNRHRLLWAIATRRQLDGSRSEPRRFLQISSGVRG